MSYTSKKTNGITVEHLTAVETAKLIRTALKKSFPNTKFSVRSDSMIHVIYQDGPALKEVEAITYQFEGKHFDGMIDLEYSSESWLMPDGTAQRAYSSGTVGSGGVDEPYKEEKPHPDAKLVSFGTYVNVSRTISPEFMEAILKSMIAKYGHLWRDTPTVKIMNLKRSKTPEAWVQTSDSDAQRMIWEAHQTTKPEEYGLA